MRYTNPRTVLLLCLSLVRPSVLKCSTHLDRHPGTHYLLHFVIQQFNSLTLGRSRKHTCLSNCDSRMFDLVCYRCMRLRDDLVMSVCDARELWINIGFFAESFTPSGGTRIWFGCSAKIFGTVFPQRGGSRGKGHMPPKPQVIFYQHNTTSSWTILQVYGHYGNVPFIRLALLGLYYFAT